MTDHAETMNVMRPQDQYQKFLELLAEEEKRFISSDSGGIASALGDIPEQCVACATPLSGNTNQGYNSCAACGTLNSSPRLRKEFLPELWQPNSAADFFHQYVYSAGAAARKEKMGPRLEELKKYLKRGRVIEVGCSIGIFLDLLVEAGFQAEGVEVVPHSIGRCRDKGHTIHSSLLEETKLEQAYDAVVAWEVICHVADPVSFFNKAANCLKEGGFLFLSTPNSLSLEYDTIWEDGLRHHPNLMPHIFMQIFSLKGITKLLRKMGFVIIKASTPGTLDFKNMNEVALREERRFSSDLLNQLILEDNDQLTKGSSLVESALSEAGYSGHAFVIARKQRCLGASSDLRSTQETP